MKMMKMMKVIKLLLFLSSVLCVSADEVLHQDINIVGCSDSDGEMVYALDGEEMWYADFINKKGVEPQPSFIDHMSYQEGTYESAVANQQICRQNLNTLRTALKDIPLEQDPPSNVIIYSEDSVEVGVSNTLICFVTGFYPAPVKVSWTKNNEDVTSGSRINVPFFNRDQGSFTQISRLDFTPQLGDIYSCSVEHLALKKPMTRMWDVEEQTPQPGIGPSVFCGVGLTLGLLGVAAGTFFLIKGNECS